MFTNFTALRSSLSAVFPHPPFPVVYLKVSIIMSRKTLEGHNQHIENVLGRLETAGLKLNARKCEFVQQRSVIFGHVISKEGISTDPDKVKVLEKWPIPNNLSDLRLFLDCTGYYRQYIRDYARIAKPLY